ncbi:heavy-metal-associated domain-containing protein [Neisseria sp.]|uniref:heavy-metal-associated domain-containing protein n=1 Tax=Neisseria sp. TaxID=192066 RepID=UPI00289B9F05|nr:heavy-metal-associated domain-containing protein [Neisseria sp.]
MQTLTLKIDGMTCGGCVKSVTTVLENLEGVEKAEVSLENANAIISFDESKIQPAALIEAVEEAGFDAAL